MDWLDLTLWFLVMGIEATLVVLLLRSRAYRLFPVFTLFLASTVVSDLLGFFVRKYAPADFYFQLYLYETPVDFLLQFGVLVELAWSVLRPVQSVLPRRVLVVIAAVILLAGAVVWPIAGITLLPNLPWQWHLLMRLQQTFAILRILVFLILAGGSQLLSLGWRDRELQVATGLGFYSLVSMAVTLFHAQVPNAIHYHRGDQIISASYLCSLAYWLYSFAQKEALRQEFSPEMQSFLLRVAGVAHANRIALENHSLPGDRRH